LTEAEAGWFRKAILAYQKGEIDDIAMIPINQNSGHTLLHYACLYGDIKVVRFILETLNSKNEDSL